MFETILLDGEMCTWFLTEPGNISGFDGTEECNDGCGRTATVAILPVDSEGEIYTWCQEDFDKRFFLRFDVVKDDNYEQSRGN